MKKISVNSSWFKSIGIRHKLFQSWRESIEEMTEFQKTKPCGEWFKFHLFLSRYFFTTNKLVKEFLIKEKKLATKLDSYARLYWIVFTAEYFPSDNVVLTEDQLSAILTLTNKK